MQNFFPSSFRVNITFEYVDKKTSFRNVFQSKCSHVNDKKADEYFA